MTDQHDTSTLDLPATGPRMGLVQLYSIAPSLTNPRKHFDPTKLQELADSIAATGVHQPVLLRPLLASRLQDTFQRDEALPIYELVAGERRYRACKLAGVVEIPAMVRALTDAQALEIQVIENLQREDVTKLEEAEGFRTLMDGTGQGADEVAAKVGKSRSYVFSVLKILDLCEHGRELLRTGVMDFSVGLSVARIPAESLQLKALKHIEDAAEHGGGYSAREAQQMVRREFMLRLDRATFDTTDATLTGGACGDCPHRTGANPDLFADVDSADVCTNPPCFHAKEEAHAAQVRERAQAQGCDVIDGREAKAIMQSAYTEECKGYLRLDSTSDSPVPGKTLRKLVAKVLESSGIKPTMIVSPHDGKTLVAVVTPEQAQQLLAMAGADDARDQVQAQAKRAADHAEAQEQQAAKIKFEQGWRDEVLRLCAQKLASDKDGLLDAVGFFMAELVQRELGTLNKEQTKRLCKLLGVELDGEISPAEALKDMAANATFPEYLWFAMTGMRDAEYRPWLESHKPGEDHNPLLTTLAEALAVDVNAAKATVQANLRADKAAKAKPAASATAPAAQASGKAVRETQKSKGEGKKQAARKTTSREAQAAIAEAMQAADEPGAADAAQSDDAPATAQAPSAPAEPSTDANTGPAKTWADGERPPEGTRVRIVGGMGTKQAERHGQIGTVTRWMGDRAVDVRFDNPQDPRMIPKFVAFDVSEVERC